MDERLHPDEAAEALTEIGHRQEQVIKHAVVPRWFWWTIAGLMVGFAAAVESQVPLAIGIGTTAFVCGVVAATVGVVVGTARRAQLRSELLNPAGVFAILGFVAIVVGISLPTSFALQAAGVPYPATWGILVGAAIMVAGEPVLSRTLQRIMLANRVGSRR